jgi:hypothetical protein
MNVFKPAPAINYNFISSIYAFFSLLGCLLYALETLAFAPHKDSVDTGVDGGNSTMKELAESTEGLYLIFIPFIPCFLWSLIVRKEYCRLQDETARSESDIAVAKKKEE